MTHLIPGGTAPGFSFENQEGKISSLKNFKGKKLILFFIQKIIHQVVLPKPATLEIIFKY